ncbi:hypothetical protein [Streptomyces sp. NPDC048411]|uniref:hypothetical protein n=1 Tax=Streptomyces sp. NPDC048411 TaxID=3157206 RepID=UPI00345212F1
MSFDENEPQAVRDDRLAAERAWRRAARRSASLDLRGAHIGLSMVAVALVLLGWYGKLVALGIVSSIFLLWSAIALIWVHADGDRGRQAFQRVYNATFGWGNGL